MQNDILPSYAELMEKDESVSVHHRNIQSLAIEMRQMKIVTDIFRQTIQEYNFRQNRDFRIPSLNTVYNGSESTSCLGPKV